MKPTVWRRLILAFALLASVQALVDLAGAYRVGSVGGETVRLGGVNATYRIVSMTKPSAFDAPVHVGDTFSLANRSLAERLRFDNERSGDRFDLIMGDGRHVHVTLQAAPATALDFVFAILRLSMIVIGALVALRRPERQEARTLANFLVLFGFASVRQPQPFFPDLAFLGLIFVQQIALLLALAQAVRLATVFPDPNADGLRAVIRRWNPLVTAAFIGLALYLLSFDVTSAGDPPALATTIAIFVPLYFVVAMTVSFWIANHRAEGADRPRVRWVSASMAVGFSGVLVESPLAASGFTAWWLSFLGLTLLAIPLGLSYAMLRHRVIDVGFALNRALVFGSLSSAVVIAFTVLEWFLGKYVVELTHVTSTSIEILFALLVGASLRSMHRRVEQLADDLFFRDRHRAEAELRRLVVDLPYITDVRTIYDRTIEEIHAHAGAAGVALYVLEEHRYARVAGAAFMPEAVDENDALFVRLRAVRGPVAAHGLGTALEAELACPFVVRGKLAGALVCTAKRSGEAYAPDETAIIADVARAVGSASDDLYTETLQRELERLQHERSVLRALAAVTQPG